LRTEDIKSWADFALDEHVLATTRSGPWLNMSNSHFGFSTKAFGFPSLQSALLLLIAIVATTFFAIREIFKPVDRRPAPQGKKWKLPPGPAGWPIIGNLLELQAGPAAVSNCDCVGWLLPIFYRLQIWESMEK